MKVTTNKTRGQTHQGVVESEGTGAEGTSPDANAGPMNNASAQNTGIKISQFIRGAL
jgi:hypothetical protein